MPRLRAALLQNDQWALEVRIEGGLDNEGVLVLRLDPTADSALPPREVVLLLDASGSMRREWDAVAREACVIMNALPRHTCFSALAFSDAPTLIVDRANLEEDRSLQLQALQNFVPPFQGTRLGAAVQAAASILRREGSFGPPVLFVATDGRSEDGVDLTALQEAQPFVTLHITAYTPAPDAVRLGQLASATGGSYLYCPSADAAGSNQELAQARARQILASAPTPLRCVAVRVLDAASGAPLQVPRFMDLSRPLRMLPRCEVRLPFASNYATTFSVQAQCLDGTQITSEVLFNPAAPPPRSNEALTDLDNARIAEAARAAAGGDRTALPAMVAQARARSDAAARGSDAALIAATANALRSAQDLLQHSHSAPAELPHLAARMSSCSQGGGGGGDAEAVTRLSDDITASLSQPPHSEAPQDFTLLPPPTPFLLRA